MKIDYFNLEKKINYKFKAKKLLIKSLTHKSYDKINNNEKIEFLGDRVLGLIIAKKLLEIYPEEKEGILDKKFASLVNKKTCLQIANDMSLEKYILTFNPKNRKIKVEDKGFTAAENFILTFWSKNIKDSVITQIDPKTKLQEHSLKKYKKLPTYKIISNTGPRHKPLFKVAVKLPDTKFYIGQGSSKKDAEQNAAIICLESNL